MRFISDDGKVFNTAEECANYENNSREAEARRAAAEAQRKEDERRKAEEERERKFKEEKIAAFQKVKDAEKAYMEAQREYIQKYCMNDSRTDYQTGQQEDPFQFVSSLADLLTNMLR